VKKLSLYPEVLTVKELKQILRIGTRQTYELVKTTDFDYIRLPNTNLFIKDRLIKWLQGSL
jgi:hypothetical protein